MLYLSQGVKTLVMAAIAVAVFIPWNLSSIVTLPEGVALVADLLFFLGKVILVMFLSVSLVRVAMARFQINRVVSVFWIYLGLIGLVGLLLLMADAALPAAGVLA